MLYSYRGYNGIIGVCDIEIFDNVVIATELPDNSGVSITNFAEGLATLICKENKINPKDLVWVEHYPDRYMSKESYDLVKFDIDEARGELCNPNWTRISGDIKKFIESKRIKKKAKGNKHDMFNENKTINTPEVTFILESEYLKNNEVTYNKGTGHQIVNGIPYSKVGNFRCDFENTTGKMWVKWMPCVPLEALQSNAEAMKEMEAVLSRFRNELFPTFSKLMECCVWLNNGDIGEARLIGVGNFATMYKLQLIPRRGDYNLYIHCYMA